MNTSTNNRDPRRVEPGRWLLLAALAAAFGAGAFGLWYLITGGTYLQLQRASDPVHRLVIIGLPVAAGLLVLLWMLSELAKLRAWLRWTGRTLFGLALCGLLGLPIFVVLFDLCLEARGLEGQLEITAAPAAPPSELLPAGAWQEASAQRPGLIVEGLAGGEYLTLDRRSLARKRPDGSFAWHLPRPGPPPARLVLADGRLYYTGPGGAFEDDVIVAALDPSRGAPLWRLNGLGRAVSEAVIDARQLAVASRRPSGSAVRLLDLQPPAVRWATRLDGAVDLPPRFSQRTVLVVVDAKLIRLSRDDGRELGRRPACQAPELACRAGRIVSWARGGSP